MLPIKIFIVDDDVDEFVFYYTAFEKEEVETDLFCFRNPEGVIPYLENLKEDEFPSLIVSDLNMPKINGYQLLNELKSSKRHANIPVVICSSSEDLTHMEKCKSVGAHDYFIKPFHFSQYKQMVGKIIDHCLNR